METQFQLIKHFGPSIFKVKIPDNMLVEINNYIEDTISNNQKIKKLDYGEGLAGDVTQEFKLEKEFAEEIGWLDFLATCVGKWIQLTTDKKISKFHLLESWVVRQFKNEFNPVHWHTGHVSGAGFLKLPESFGETIQNKNNIPYVGGSLELIHGSKMFLSNSKFRIKPEVGDFYFFPNYLMHVVYPFRNTDEERRSISFNAKIDDDIYNAYK